MSKVKYIPVLTNTRIYPYRTSNSDMLQVKLEVLSNGRVSYKSGITAELWLNYGSYWRKYETEKTNKFGTANFIHSCVNVPLIDHCLGYSKIIIDGKTYISNIVRFNFITKEFLFIIINAGNCKNPPSDRSTYDVIDASANREYEFDRMVS